MKNHLQPAVYPFITIFVILLLSTSGCKKENENWVWCSDCNSEKIIGNYLGTATHYKYQNDTLHYIETKDKEVNLKITQEGSQLKVQVGVVNLFNESASGSYNNTYYITFSGGRINFSATIYENKSAIKLAGTTKKLSSSGNFPTELLEFEVLKTD